MQIKIGGIVFIFVNVSGYQYITTKVGPLYTDRLKHKFNMKNDRLGYIFGRGDPFNMPKTKTSIRTIEFCRKNLVVANLNSLRGLGKGVDSFLDY